MRLTLLTRIAGAAGTLVASAAAHAHGGHGLPGASHWHASDTLGLLLVAVLASAALWWSRRGD